ncbi:DUF3172 domain-containing protein [Okeania sp. KiyG1]|uniref:DUF3172 domain-containing protein n=1 Tax=Okeania sp. KiyG1 TaxID=2720165 RepID=UPI0019208801|nr:DUF3172 domain-containing protein [Okeania sp. KiyG1]GGA24737.1 hypothetical protein CYANOKiyG1_40370 [Okeania sp. KiyG1]
MKRTPQTTTEPSRFNYATIAILGGVFVLGIGIGIAFSSTANFTPQNVASREFIDRSVPNPELCVQFGASAMVTNMRVFLTLNPFNVYVSQPNIKPGCVIRRNNWSILEKRNLLSNEQVRDCKNRMNTFGYTGNINDDPEINCIYQNDSAQNLFLPDQLGPGGNAPENNF